MILRTSELNCFNFKKVYFVNLENLISWRSEYSGINKLSKTKKYDSDSYKENINFKAINIFKKININSKTLIKNLNSRLKFYDKYLTKFAASNLKTSGNKEIVRIIKSRYF